jgi:hypothetical protein
MTEGIRDDDLWMGKGGKKVYNFSLHLLLERIRKKD